MHLIPSQVRLGNSGLKVSQIILGCMSYGSSEWRPWTLDEEESIKHIKYAYEAGIQTFDTANMYSNGMSEIVLGNAIKKEIVVMTKMEAHEVVNFRIFHVMQNYAITHNLTPFISMQNHYTDLLHREEEREMMPSLKVHPSILHFLVWIILPPSKPSPLALALPPGLPLHGGALTRPAGAATSAAEKTLRQESESLDANNAYHLTAMGRERDTGTFSALHRPSPCPLTVFVAGPAFGKTRINGVVVTWVVAMYITWNAYRPAGGSIPP
ncbi:NADP-dependent oxidoreductase domain-containing protein [Mycena olivaceomarginata]|nr:NADP-dependent oxidoreductase domain-containing protein [Mycena olivaceomarginata]